MKSWKTTLTGVAMIITGIVMLASHGNTETAVATIMGGIGLIAAKDGNVTGGTVQQ